MKNRLYIRLPADDRQSLHWGIWSGDQKQWLEHGDLLAVDLVSLAEQSAKCETVVIVSSLLARQKKVVTPAKQQKQIQRAVPYMLEEHLAAPIDQLHFAYGKRDKNGEVDVVWTTQHQMERWLEWFEQSELKVDNVVSELSLIKGAADASEVVLDDAVAMVSMLNEAPWSCQRDLLPMLWPEGPKNTDETEMTADEVEPIRMFHTGDLEEFWMQQEGVFAQPISEQELLETLALNFSKDTVNLLQQQYAPKKESNIQLKKYRPLLMMSLVALVVHLVYQGSQFFQLAQEQAALREQGEGLFERAFGRKPRDASLLAQTERLAKRSANTGGEGEFLKLLNAMSTQIVSIETIRPTSITFDNRRSELRVDVLAPDYQTLNNFKAELAKQGLNVDMSSASAQGELYSSRLVLRSGS